MSNEVIISSVTVLDDNTRFTLLELCRLGQTSAEWVIELVEEGVLEPEGSEIGDWRFGADALKRLQAVQRLQRDLRINLPGAALVLELLEEVEMLRQRYES
ncbi:chaperone modulator CbpM [Methylotuvimicrobium alcaliphilum]|uniref:Chaperone-modulator protein CbpM n=1 Tax=Methylotuvimicrobium alcaliphilum (strain DSM 19304 / NCIMB 14124 / VKM B-2133 / 20Z) TaxID=1091494 RepID=G4SYQ4_META2|nr:chaperone modulator CbpM [Methylotuvimicrobium alcaliphilum]CCE24351.1 putative chaperone-modulator protein CbpM [Methylotuvimicrobium alcaliphilum 20Z]